MKIIVLHGDDIEKSRSRLLKFESEAKKRNWEIAEYSLTDVVNPSLFGKERFFILSDYKKLNKKDLDLIKDYSGNLVIHNEGTIPQTFIKILPKESKIELYELPKIIFRFLETFDTKLLHDLLKNNSVEFIFSLFCRQIRDLYLVKLDPSSLGYPSWRLSKLNMQSKKYSADILKNIIDSLSETDYKVKTGNSNLTSLLDLIIIKYLQ